MEHPIITRLNNYGHLEDEETIVGYFGEKIYVDCDNYIMYEGDTFLKENLKEYLILMGFKFYE